jgi:hypothetical protein
MEIKDGATVSNVEDEKTHTIKFYSGNNHAIEMWINDSVSYLTLEEAVLLKNELQKTIIESINRG